MSEGKTEANTILKNNSLNFYYGFLALVFASVPFLCGLLAVLKTKSINGQGFFADDFTNAMSDQTKTLAFRRPLQAARRTGEKFLDPSAHAPSIKNLSDYYQSRNSCFSFAAIAHSLSRSSSQRSRFVMFPTQGHSSTKDVNRSDASLS